MHLLCSYHLLSVSDRSQANVLCTVHETNATSHIINRMVMTLLCKDSIKMLFVTSMNTPSKYFLDLYKLVLLKNQLVYKIKFLA